MENRNEEDKLIQKREILKHHIREKRNKIRNLKESVEEEQFLIEVLLKEYENVINQIK